MARQWGEGHADDAIERSYGATTSNDEGVLVDGRYRGGDEPRRDTSCWGSDGTTAAATGACGPGGGRRSRRPNRHGGQLPL